MKKAIVLTIILSCISFLGFAQQADTPPVGNNIQALKIAFVTKELALTPDEAQKFWPVYYNYLGEVKKARQERKVDVLIFEETVLNIRKKYKNDFKKVLNTDDRVNKVLFIDRDFNNVLKKELQKRIQNRNKLKDLN